MKRGSQFFLLIVGLCVAAVLTVKLASADKFELTSSGASGDVEFLKQFMRKEIEKFGWNFENHFKIFNPPFDRFSPLLVPHLRRDLNNDGSEELVAQFRHPGDCGSGGCTSFIFRIVDGKWVEIGRFAGGDAVEITEPFVDGWPRLFSHEACLVWNGIRYKEFNNDPFEMGVDPECRR